MDPSHDTKFSMESIIENMNNNNSMTFPKNNNTFPITSPGTGIVRLEAYPSNAEVYLDGQFLGITPLSITDVDMGSHGFIVRKLGYEDYNGQVFVNDGSFNPMDVYLQPQQIPIQPMNQAGSPISPIYQPYIQPKALQMQTLQTNNQVTLPTNVLLGLGILIVGGLLALAWILKDKK